MQKQLILFDEAILLQLMFTRRCSMYRHIQNEKLAGTHLELMSAEPALRPTAMKATMKRSLMSFLLCSLLDLFWLCELLSMNIGVEI